MLHLIILCCLPAQTVESADFPEVSQRAVLGATVRVMVDGEKSGAGTGIVVRQQGAFRYVLTAAHVVAKAQKLEVHSFSAKSHPDPAETTREVEVLASFPDQDLAVLRIPAGKLAVAPLILAPRGSAPKEARFSALTTGCDGGAAPTCLAEEVRGKKLLRPAKDKTFFAWEVAGSPAAGRSGGPLVDPKGRLLGICTGTQDGRGYYTHLDEIHAALKREGLAWIGEEAEKEPERKP